MGVPDQMASLEACLSVYVVYLAFYFLKKKTY